ncbi:MAG: hypothetical protein AB8B72_11795 [Crocinitomicaceae bacterium]
MNPKVLQVIFFFLVFVNCNLFSQVVSIDYILEAPIQKKRKVDLGQSNIVALATQFGDFAIEDMKALDTLNENRIERIDLVYTQFVESETFVQPKLNRDRLEYLLKYRPYIFENNLIEWNIICQTGAKTSDVAKDYFHGFIIHYKDEASELGKLSTKDEMAALKRCLSSCRIGVGDTIRDISDVLELGRVVLDTITIIDSIIKIPTGMYRGKFLEMNPYSVPRRSYFTNEVKKQLVFNSHINTDTLLMITPYSKRKTERIDSAFYPKSKRKAQKGIIYSKKSIWGRKQVVKRYLLKDTVFLNVRNIYVVRDADSLVFSRSCYRKVASNTFTDTIVGKTFSTIREWENKIVVEDVTGSMYPYLTQTFLWRRLATDSTKLTKFVFFNDGDSKRNHEKVIGSTGGIYDVDSPNIEIIEGVGLKTMSLGRGGDCPENNIEALLYASDFCPTCELLMIADNNAPIKDIVLMKSLTKPVDVILCGVRYGRIQASYLTLVREVGGNIYTMEGELKEIAKLKEGEKIDFGGQKFKIIGGKFILVR